MKTQQERKKKIMTITILGSIANFLLLIFKFLAAGWLGQSSAFISSTATSPTTNREQ